MSLFARCVRIPIGVSVSSMTTNLDLDFYFGDLWNEGDDVDEWMSTIQTKINRTILKVSSATWSFAQNRHFAKNVGINRTRPAGRRLLHL